MFAHRCELAEPSVAGRQLPYLHEAFTSNMSPLPLFPIVLQLSQLHSCHQHSLSPLIQECYILLLMGARAWSMGEEPVFSQNTYKNCGLEEKPRFAKNKWGERTKPRSWGVNQFVHERTEVYNGRGETCFRAIAWSVKGEKAHNRIKITE